MLGAIIDKWLTSNRNDNIVVVYEDVLLKKKILIASEGFTTSRFCELILRDRMRLSR